jgi:hypothetical protein
MSRQLFVHSVVGRFCKTNKKLTFVARKSSPAGQGPKLSARNVNNTSFTINCHCFAKSLGSELKIVTEGPCPLLEFVMDISGKTDSFGLRRTDISPVMDLRSLDCLSIRPFRLARSTRRRRLISNVDGGFPAIVSPRVQGRRIGTQHVSRLQFHARKYIPCIRAGFPQSGRILSSSGNVSRFGEIIDLRSPSSNQLTHIELPLNSTRPSKTMAP